MHPEHGEDEILMNNQCKKHDYFSTENAADLKVTLKKTNVDTFLRILASLYIHPDVQVMLGALPLIIPEEDLPIVSR